MTSRYEHQSVCRCRTPRRAAQFLCLVMLALPLSAGPALAAEQGPANEPLGSPQDAVRTFLDAMNACREGEAGALDHAVACLQLDDLPAAEQASTGAQYARQLFDILDRATVNLDDLPRDVPEGTGEVRLTVRPADTDDPAFAVAVCRGDDGRWRVASDTLRRIPAYCASLEDAPSPESENSGNPALRSPRDTMRTFLEGMSRWDDGGEEEALAALDLSGVEESVRIDKGREAALYLKRILLRDGKVTYQAIHNDPAGPPYTHLKHRAGSIVIAPVTDEETGAVDWKFTAETVENIVGIYDAVKGEFAPGAEAGAGEPVILSIMVRDWIDARFPVLLKRAVLLENWQWLGLFVVILLGMAASRAIAYVLIAGLRRWFRRERMSLDIELEKDFVRPIRIALMAWVWFLALKTLYLPAHTLYYLRVAAATVSAAGGVWAFYRLVDILGQYLSERAARTENKFDDILVPLVTRSLKVFIATFGVVFVAEIAGFKPTSVLAGLGLGGLAFALAAKDTLSNVFGSLTILLDRPFQIGDWIIVGDVEGSVETVGIRSTRVRTFYNSLITVPNSQLINATVDNMGARRFRRISTKIAVTYDTPPEKIEAFCEGIRELIRRHPYTRKDYFHVWLNEFAAASLNILLYCFHEAPDWSTELRERHRLYLDIIRLAKRLGVEFAFPTQTLYVRQDSVPAAAFAAATPGKALVLGKEEAARIVDEFLGGPDRPPPPPVTFESPPVPADAPADTDTKRGSVDSEDA
ncbi:MAG: mechanosensitive ion channel family protein [Candidatus Hydrogenedentes bacterium]|nr:mechanosensitive ion channel family protein [Candidatus Hydrogenedentota bacterium]